MTHDNKEVCVMKHNEKFFEQFDAGKPKSDLDIYREAFEAIIGRKLKVGRLASNKKAMVATHTGNPTTRYEIDPDGTIKYTVVAPPFQGAVSKLLTWVVIGKLPETEVERLQQLQQNVFWY